MIYKVLSIFTCIFLLLSSSIVRASEFKPDGEYVVILHGIGRSNTHMEKMSTYLENNGFDVINLNYPSTDYKIEDLTKIINTEISKRAIKDKPINFVGYSMGGLMVRALINKYHYKNLGRVVQLAPPNQGSEIADFVKNFWPYKKIYGPDNN